MAFDIHLEPGYYMSPNYCNLIIVYGGGIHEVFDYGDWYKCPFNCWLKNYTYLGPL